MRAAIHDPTGLDFLDMICLWIPFLIHSSQMQKERNQTTAGPESEHQTVKGNYENCIIAKTQKTISHETKNHRVSGQFFKGHFDTSLSPAQ